MRGHPASRASYGAGRPSDAPQTFVEMEGGSSLSARRSACASSRSCSWDIAKLRHCATLPGRYFKISVSGSSETRFEESYT